LKHREHRLLDRLLLGREYGDVHAWMDEPARWLGPRHRILRHSPLEVLVKYYNDPNRLASAMLHILADKAESRVRGGRRRA
jgi:hypothetical protein